MDLDQLQPRGESGAMSRQGPEDEATLAAAVANAQPGVGPKTVQVTVDSVDKSNRPRIAVVLLSLVSFILLVCTCTLGGYVAFYVDTPDTCATSAASPPPTAGTGSGGAAAGSYSPPPPLPYNS